eukprot:41315_1
MRPNEEEKKLETNDNEEPFSLISAAMRGDQTETKALISNPDIDINGVDDKGNSALLWAAYFDEPEVMQLLINAPNINLHLKSKRGNTVLHMAAVANATKALHLILNLGTDSAKSLFNARNIWGETALHLAASTGKVQAIDALCNAKVDTTITDNWNRTALRVAYENIETNAINTLTQYCTAQVIEDAKKVEESRIKLGKEAESNKETQNIPMSNREMMEEFMSEMKNMQKKIKESLSFEKLKEKHAFDVGGKVVDRKVEEAAAVGGVEKTYKYKLASKFEYGTSPKTVEELEEWLADDEINNDGKDMFGWSALHKVIFWQKNEFVVPLLENMSADTINNVGPEGEAAIHMAVTLVLNGGKKQILEWICNCPKVDKLRKNKAGCTAIDIANKHNADKDVIALLR